MAAEDLGKPDGHCVADLSGNLLIQAMKHVRIRKTLQTRSLAKRYCPILAWMPVSAVGQTVTSARQRRRRRVPSHAPVHISVTVVTALVAIEFQFMRP